MSRISAVYDTVPPPCPGCGHVHHFPTCPRADCPNHSENRAPDDPAEREAAGVAEDLGEGWEATLSSPGICLWFRRRLVWGFYPDSPDWQFVRRFADSLRKARLLSGSEAAGTKAGVAPMILTLDLSAFDPRTLKLLGAACWRWEDGGGIGAPAIDGKRPYGNSSAEHDMAEILGTEGDDTVDLRGLHAALLPLLEEISRRVGEAVP